MDTKTVQPIPYLFFDGTCAEALAFYAEVLGGTIGGMLTYGAMPGEMPCPEEAKDRIMNGVINLPGGGLLYGSDSFPGRNKEGTTGYMIALNYETVPEAQVVFERLAVGGQVAMPFGPTFWAEGFGMVTDKYGVEWAVNGSMRNPNPS